MVLRSIAPRHACAPAATRSSLPNNCLCPRFVLFLGRCRFIPSIRYPSRFLYCIGHHLVRFSPSGWCFILPCDHGLDLILLTSAYVRIQSNKSIIRSCKVFCTSSAFKFQKHKGRHPFRTPHRTAEGRRVSSRHRSLAEGSARSCYSIV